MDLKKRILYIEDDTDLQWLVRHILESAGVYEVRLCSSGAEGLDVMDKFDPDLVLLDVMLPGMDGFNVLSALRAKARWARLPVAFLTARMQHSDEYLTAGAQGVIAKPFEPSALLERVRALTGELASA